MKTLGAALVLPSLALLSLLGLAGCSDEENARQDAGAVQIPEGPASDGVEISVWLQDCLGGCDVLDEASCNAELVGDKIVVTSRFTWTTEAKSACNEMCRTAEATCTLAPLEDGEYAVQHGSDAGTLTVEDGSVEALCFGSTGYGPCGSF